MHVRRITKKNKKKINKKNGYCIKKKIVTGSLENSFGTRENIFSFAYKERQV